MTDRFDLIIIGGGILGLATALEVVRSYPRLRIAVLEKETQVATHQTGHNSGVIHSGIYYKPGSLKARYCVAGAQLLTAFCDQHEIPYERCGKVVVAKSDYELPRLYELHRRGIANGVAGVQIIETERLRELEPNATGVKALYVPQTGIVDYTRVAQQFATLVCSGGGTIDCGQSVRKILQKEDQLIVETDSKTLHASNVINCAGLQSDRIARLAGAEVTLRIVPFRGEYYTIASKRRHLVKNLIYPVPDPAFPFLGVHFTRTVDGCLEAGPNAVLAMAREGYSWSDIVIEDLWETIRFPGFHTVTRKYWKTGLGEIFRSLSKSAFLKALRKIVPDLRETDLGPGGSGVRAQAITSRGDMVDDFVITNSPKAIHVLNAPSPGATASLAIGKHIVEIAAETFSWSKKQD